MMNLCQANIAHVIAATAPRGRGRKTPKFKDFTFDFKKAIMSEQEKVDDKIRRIFK
ncbi:MAG: hypothetical protein V3U78_09985 [Thiotrichaceae bacterium]